MHEQITAIVVDYDPNGSLVTTHESQGTDMGLYGGLLGWEADDEQMPHYRSALEKAGIETIVNYLDYQAPHPNYYRISISNQWITHTLSAISTGGGMMEVLNIDGAEVSIFGDKYVVLIYGENLELLRSMLPDWAQANLRLTASFIEISTLIEFKKEEIAELESLSGVSNVCQLKPVVPVLEGNTSDLPFRYCSQMIELGNSEKLELWELGLLYESKRGNISQKKAWSKMENISKIMKEGIKKGMRGTHYEDRILPVQSIKYKLKDESGQLLNGGMLNKMIMYTTAMMEVKSAMEVFVAAPTAGSCRVLPGTLFGAAEALDSDPDTIVKALFSAGIIGVFIAEHATFSAEVAGCQAETGAGGSMAAAALVTLIGGSLKQSVTAASFALQNSLGIICDPIGNRVEAPCLGKNVMAASNALSCANMALSDYEALIPFDEVVMTMKEVGDAMTHELKCTGLGGLAATPAAKAIEKKLKEKAKFC
jgi:L-serine dehydratase